MLYALYAFPNVVIPLIGGIIIDKYGARIALMLSAMFCVLGQIIWGFGGYENTFFVMLMGRVVFGIGGEVLHASQNTLISNWFKASELSVDILRCRWYWAFVFPFRRWAVRSMLTSHRAFPTTLSMKDST